MGLTYTCTRTSLFVLWVDVKNLIYIYIYTGPTTRITDKWAYALQHIWMTFKRFLILNIKGISVVTVVIVSALILSYKNSFPELVRPTKTLLLVLLNLQCVSIAEHSLGLVLLSLCTYKPNLIKIRGHREERIFNTVYPRTSTAH